MTDELVLPHSLEAERAVLGALLIQSDRWVEVADLLTAEDFYRYAHAEVWRAMASVADHGVPLDMLTVKDALIAKGALDSVGGPTYLAALVDGVPRASNVAYYAGIVRQHALRRRIVAAGNDLVRQAVEGEREAAELLDEAQQFVLSLSASAATSDFVDGEQLAHEMVAALEQRVAHGAVGLNTGLHDLDDMTGGLVPGNLIILAARPSMGKSALAVNIAWHVAVKSELDCALFSLEMGKDELRDRMVGTAARVSSGAIRAGRIQGDDWTRVSEACGALARGRLHIDDAGTQSSLSVRAKSRRFHAKTPLSLVVVDYLQLMHEPGKWERRELMVGSMSRNLKSLAKELQIPVIALCQLNRGPETRPDHRPMLSDLRESGALEQDADQVWLLFREHVYSPTPENEHDAELNIAKQRNGRTGIVHLSWDGQYFQFGSRWRG